MLPRYLEVVDGIVKGTPLESSGAVSSEPSYRCDCDPELGHTWHPQNVPTTEPTDDEEERALTLEEWKALHTGDGHQITVHRIIPIGRRTDIKPDWLYNEVSGVFSAPTAKG